MCLCLPSAGKSKTECEMEPDRTRSQYGADRHPTQESTGASGPGCSRACPAPPPALELRTRAPAPIRSAPCATNHLKVPWAHVINRLETCPFRILGYKQNEQSKPQAHRRRSSCPSPGQNCGVQSNPASCSAPWACGPGSPCSGQTSLCKNLLFSVGFAR